MSLSGFAKMYESMSNPLAINAQQSPYSIAFKAPYTGFTNAPGAGTVLRNSPRFPFNMGNKMGGVPKPLSSPDLSGPDGFARFTEVPGQGTVLRNSRPFPFNMGTSMDGDSSYGVLRRSPDLFDFPTLGGPFRNEESQPPDNNGQMPPFPPMMFGFRSPHQYGNHLGNVGANFLGNLAVNQLGGFFGAADRVANDVNAGMSGLQTAMTNAANRQMLSESMRQRERMFNRLAASLLGGSRMNGIADTASNLQVGGPSVSTNITAQPLSLSQILQADNQMRNSPLTNYSPGRSVSPQAQGELNQLLRSQVRDMAPNAERALIDANEPFARDIQAARSNQFLGLGQLLAGLQGDQIENQARNLPYLLQMLG